MPSWLERALEIAARLVPNPILDLVSFTASALGGLLGTVSNNVADAWHEFATGLDVLRGTHFSFTADLLGVLERIVLHWIPRYAVTAWWWVTHPEQLARQLVLYVVHWLEREAWTIAPYLGRFLLALLVRNVGRVARLTEAIVSAIL